MIKLPDACPTCTSSTPRLAIVFAEPNSNAFVEQLQSTPLADVLQPQVVQVPKFSTPSLASADAHLLPHAVAVSSSTPKPAHVSLTPTQDASHLFTLSTPVFATADAELLLSALAVLPLSTPPADALLSHHAQLLKCSTSPLADADAHQCNSAVADSSSTVCPARACQTPTPDACPTCTDSTPPVATASA